MGKGEAVRPADGWRQKLAEIEASADWCDASGLDKSIGGAIRESANRASAAFGRRELESLPVSLGDLVSVSTPVGTKPMRLEAVGPKLVTLADGPRRRKFLRSSGLESVRRAVSRLDSSEVARIDRCFDARGKRRLSR